VKRLLAAYQGIIERAERNLPAGHGRELEAILSELEILLDDAKGNYGCALGRRSET
jgi:hypothetical protein